MSIRYAGERDKAGVILQLSSLTVEEFEELVPLVQNAFLEYMNKWTLEGKLRSGRRYSQYTNCPLPTPEDRLLFVLMYLKGAPLQLAHATAFGLTQPKANLWLHLLLNVLRNALASSGDLPARSLQALQERLAALTTPDSSQPPIATAETPPTTLFFMTAPSAPSLGPRTQLNKKSFTAARKSGI